MMIANQGISIALVLEHANSFYGTQMCGRVHTTNMEYPESQKGFIYSRLQ